MEFSLNAKVLLCQTHSRCGHRTPVGALDTGWRQGCLVCFDHILCGAATHFASSTRIKDAGTAVRHSRRTFSYPRPPECLESRISTAGAAADRPAGPPATPAAQKSQSRPPEPPRPQETASRPAKTLDLQNTLGF